MCACYTHRALHVTDACQALPKRGVTAGRACLDGLELRDAELPLLWRLDDDAPVGPRLRREKEALLDRALPKKLRVPGRFSREFEQPARSCLSSLREAA